MSNTVHTSFVLKKGKYRMKNGKHPIHLRVRVNGISKDISIGRYIEECKWSNKKNIQPYQKPEGSDRETKELIKFLKVCYDNITIYERTLKEKNKAVTAVALRNLFKGVDEGEERAKKETLLKLFKSHNDFVKSRIRPEDSESQEGYSKSTWDIFDRVYRHTAEFIKFKYNKNDIELRSLDFAFVDDLKEFFLVKKGLSNNTMQKRMATVKKITIKAQKRGMMQIDPFAEHNTKKYKVIPVYLTWHELRKIISKKFSVKRLTEIRDVFVFCCFTGLDYSTTEKLVPKHLVIGNNQKKWLIIKRKKSFGYTQIPLLTIPLAILKKYKNHPLVVLKNRLLPVKSNQKYNAYLKEIMDLCGIEKVITTHTARHTFATTVTTSSGVGLRTTSMTLGHSTLTQTEHYAQLEPTIVSNEMGVLEGKLKDVNELVMQNMV